MRLGRVSALPGAAVGPPPRDRAVGGARGGRRPPRGGARGVERAGRVGRAELRSPLPRARKCPRPRGNSRQFCRDVRHSADTTTKDIGRPVVKIAKINNFARAGGSGGAGRRGGRRGRVGANFLKHLTRAHAPPVRLPPLLTPPPGSRLPVQERGRAKTKYLSVRHRQGQRGRSSRPGWGRSRPRRPPGRTPWPVLGGRGARTHGRLRQPG